MSWFVWLAFALIDRPVFSAVRRPPRRVLVTTFVPYDGAATNGSLEVATALRTLAPRAPDLRFEFCAPLPVKFGTAPDRARACLDGLRSRPDLIVALGEGFCNLSLETFAHNLRQGGPDHAGVTLRSTPILPDGPARIAASLSFVDMYCGLTETSRARVEPSVWPGFFVCNDVAYGLGRRARELNIPFGFVHVPAPGTCPAPESPVRTAARLIRMLRAPKSVDTLCRDEFFARLARAEHEFLHRDDWRWRNSKSR